MVRVRTILNTKGGEDCCNKIVKAVTNFKRGNE